MIIPAEPGWKVIRLDPDMLRNAEMVHLRSIGVVAWSIADDVSCLPYPITAHGRAPRDALLAPDGRVILTDSMREFETVENWIAGVSTEQKFCEHLAREVHKTRASKLDEIREIPVTFKYRPPGQAPISD